MARMGQADAWLIVVELLVLFLFLGFAAYGSGPEAAYSAAFLLGNVGFVLGFLLVGLIAPLALECYLLVKGHAGSAALGRTNLYLLSGLLVLLGGYLLRQYVLLAGFYVKVW